MPERLPHLKVDAFFSSKKYVYPKQTGGGPGFNIVQRNRAIHGRRIEEQLNAIREQFAINREQPLPQNIVRDDVIYVEFFSEWDFPLKLKGLTREADNSSYQIVNVKQEIIGEGENKMERCRVVVLMKEGAVSVFLKKVAQYITDYTKDKDGNYTNTPKNEPLIANIQSIELATLRSFWSDAPEIPFPDENEVRWWEVWFRRTGNTIHSLERVTHNLIEVGAEIGQQTLEFPEHTVKLVRASANQLSGSLVLLDNLAELRAPQQLNDFITHSVDIPERQAWVNDLRTRTEAKLEDNSVVVCLLDSGVNNKHPLLEDFLPDSRLYTYKESWGKNDSCDGGGHGTGMAGLALYGNLTDALANTSRIKISHGLESFKIFYEADPNDPVLYGAVTEYACSAPVVDFPNNHRIYCLAITDNQLSFKGRPSTWSAAIDKIAYGGGTEQQLFIISGGNVNYLLPTLNATHYPGENCSKSIHDPSQSYNALTVGSYTRMDRIDQTVWPGTTALAKNGAMSPSNSTSFEWDEQWPVKPDIVMEGGNLAVRGTTLTDMVHTLKPLSLDKDFNNYILCPFGDTSGAAALASKMAAELTTAYPAFWPETIRALIVHSAQWTGSMLHGIDLQNATKEQKRQLLRTVGYGVPIPEKAFYSAKNALTLIAENTIQPYQLQGSLNVYNEYHLYEVPWPTSVLQEELADMDVQLKITLSYFIEPNPGNKRYENDFRYYSHSLDFKMIRPTETLNEFKRRISGSEENKNIVYHGDDEPWILKAASRNHGSVKKDFIVSSGADLAKRNIIAIYPKAGWYFSRKRLGMMDTKVRYSLIISIETEDVKADIYTPVLNLIESETTFPIWLITNP